MKKSSFVFSIIIGISLLSTGILPVTQSVSAEILDLENLDYTITTGTVSSIEADPVMRSLIVTVNTDNAGQLTITLPRVFIDATIGDVDDDFFVISDGEEVIPEEISTTSESRIFVISFDSGTEEIELIGTTINISAINAPLIEPETATETPQTTPQEAATETPQTTPQEAATETPQTTPQEAATETPQTTPQEAATENTESAPTQTKDNAEENGGCLIATATFGSELAPQVQQLRETRDNVLLNTESGSSFMTTFNQFYYSFSPTVADLERENPVFKEMVKITLTPLLTSLSILNYVEINSEADMLGYGISLILLNVGMYIGAPVAVIVAIRKKIV